ncbi:MAG: phosphoribosyltransferase [Elusimicrobia bacterium]|nr:phosphoribosyltransferase [Elusimicrobiota bacterium]
MFRDRRAAGRKLAQRLLPLRAGPAIVLALPRGGVEVGYEVARALEIPLDIVVARKLRAPADPELAIGAVAEWEIPRPVFNQDLIARLGVGPDYIQEELGRQLAEIRRRQDLYRGGRPAAQLRGKQVFLVDDGLATGASARAAALAVRSRGPSSVTLAVPVACAEVAAEIRREMDSFVCLFEPEPFIAVGNQYQDFEQTSDDEVVEILESARGKW